MAAQSHYLPALHKLFRTRPVALLSDLRKALQTPSRTTVFRVLSSVGYLASYSHAGRYYTLKRIPQFDPRGLWHYRQIGFSSQRTLRATLVHLVETSPAGQTHEELQDVLLLRVHNTLRLLVRARELQRRLFQDVYVYLSAKPKPASRQWAERQKLAPPPAPKELHPARVIDILVDLLHHPEDEARAVCQRLRAGRHPVTREEIRAELKERYGIVLSTGEISALGRRFLVYLEALHQKQSPALRAALEADGGCPLHIDATGEDGRGTLVTAWAGWRGWVLSAWKAPTERTEFILPGIQRVAAEFGAPCAILRDLGRAMTEAAAQYVQSLKKPIPVLACHQ